MKQEQYLPGQQHGIRKDFERSLVLETTEQAEKVFHIVADRLKNINNWDQYTGILSARFILTGQDGEALQRRAQAGDYVQISLPGPSLNTHHHDWTQLRQMHYTQNEERDEECLSMQLVPSPAPATGNNDIAHFFSDASSSNFILLRQHKKVTISYHGRNEVPNLDTEGIGNQLRNLAISVGSMLGLSDIQWTRLLDGLISAD